MIIPEEVCCTLIHVLNTEDDNYLDVTREIEYTLIHVLNTEDDR